MPARFATVAAARAKLGKAVALPKATSLSMADAIRELLAVPDVRGLLFDEEAQLSLDVHRALVEDRDRGLLRCVFSAIPIEIRIGGSQRMRNLARTLQRHQRVIGAIPGMCDWGFWWKGGGGLIELKVPGSSGPVMRVVQSTKGPSLRSVARPPGRLSPDQLTVGHWCEEIGVNRAVAHSVAEVRETLTRWGARRVS